MLEPFSTNTNPPQRPSPKLQGNSTQKEPLKQDGLWAKIYWGSKNILAHLDQYPWLHKVYEIGFDDASPVRKILSLENELAEAMDPVFEQLKAPPLFRTCFYRILWGMTYVTTGTRSLYEAIKEKNPVAGIKKIVQDLVSVVFCTTASARLTNYLQEKIYNFIKMPLILKNIARPIYTLWGCIEGIRLFDIPGEWLGDKVYNWLKPFSDKLEASRASINTSRTKLQENLHKQDHVPTTGMAA